MGILIDSTFRCGLAVRGKKILGGEETEISEYPWQVGMAYRCYDWSSNTSFCREVLCGGSLIRDQWVLTSAWCVIYFNNYDYEVVLGEHDYRDDGETNVVRAKISLIVTHPEFDRIMDYYDFALVKLEEPIDFSTYANIRPICLPSNTTQLYYPGVNATATGWGSFTSCGEASTVLREATVEVMSNDDCNEKWISGWIMIMIGGTRAISTIRRCAWPARQINGKTRAD